MADPFLVLLTNTKQVSGKANGTYFPQLSHAAKPLLDANFQLEFASISGGEAPFYGDDTDDAVNVKMLGDRGFMTGVRNTKPITELSAEDYAGVLIPGGEGLLSDLADNHQVAELLAAIYQRTGVIGTIGRGAVVLAQVKLTDGTRLLENKPITTLSAAEDEAITAKFDFTNNTKDLLTAAGAQLKTGDNNTEYTMTAGNIISGQNTASANAVATAMINAVNAHH